MWHRKSKTTNQRKMKTTSKKSLPKLKEKHMTKEEGTKKDQGKVRIDLVPPEIVFAIAEILTFGAMKYSDRNWENGMAWGRVFGALMRHLWAWWGGARPTTENFVFGSIDGETGKSHLWHAACCIAFLVTYEERKIGTDDRRKE